MISVAASLTPFGGRVWHGCARAGASIAEIVAEVPVLPVRFEAVGIVCVNGEPVPRAMWAFVRPRVDGPVPVAITLHAPLHGGGGEGGGGGSGKQILQIVAAIALIAATAFVAAGFGAGIAGGWLAAGSTSAKVLAAGLSLGASLLLNAVFTPPVQPLASEAVNKDLGSAGFNQNIAQRGSSLQYVVGTYRVAPNLVSLPLTELIGDDEYIEAVMALAGPHKQEDFQIADIDSEDLSDVEFEIREGWDTDEPLTLVTRQAFEEQPNIILSTYRVLTETDQTQYLLDQGNPDDCIPFWHQLVTRNSPDEIWLTLFWLEGQYDESVTTSNQRVPIRLRIREVGNADWINLPEIQFVGHRQSLVRHMIKIIWGSAPVPLPIAPTVDGPVSARRYSPPQSTNLTYGSPASGEWIADNIFGGSGNSYEADNVALYHDRIEIYIEEGAYPKGTYEVQIIKGQMVLGSNWSSTSYAVSGNVYDMFGYFVDSSGGQRRTIQTQGDMHYKLAVGRFASVWNEAPLLVNDGLAKLAVRVKNKSVSGVTVLASSYVRDYAFGEWGQWRTTSNPAPHYRAALIGSLNKRPLRSTQLDEESLIAWRSFCALNSLECNIVLQGVSVDDALVTLAAAGHATRRAMPYGVAWEYDRSAETPIQIFSPRTSSGYRFERAFPTLPDGFLVTFPDASEAYRATEIQVLRDGADDSNPNLILEAIQYAQITSESLARQRARLDLRQAELRGTIHTIQTDIESIICRRGDLIGLQHDVITRRAGFARISAIATSGGLVTGLTLDQEVPLVNESDNLNDVADVTLVADITNLGASSGAAIRLNDGLGTIITKTLTGSTGDTATLTFAPPFTLPSGLEVGCVVVTGLLGSEYARMIVKDVLPDSQLGATLVLVDEAPTIHPLTS